MAVSQAMNGKLNDQITREFAAAQTYLSMACVLDGMGLKALAGFFRQQSDEERGHALKIIDYLLEVGGRVTLQAVPEPPQAWNSVAALFAASLEHEQLLARQIHELVGLAEQERDYATRGFLQWLVDEQVEEIALMTQMVEVAKMAGDNLLLLESYAARARAQRD